MIAGQEMCVAWGAAVAEDVLDPHTPFASEALKLVSEHDLPRVPGTVDQDDIPLHVVQQRADGCDAHTASDESHSLFASGPPL